MAKTAYDTIMKLMIDVPRSNATFAYHQMLLVCGICGNGFFWDDTGRLVHKSEIDDKTDKDANKAEYEEPSSMKKDTDDFIRVLEKAVMERVNVHLLDRTLTVGDELEQAYIGSDNAYLLSSNVTELLNDEIHKVFTVKERMEDFTLPSEGYMFHPILKESNLCNIPDNVTWDWLVVIQKFLEIMDTYPQAVRDKNHLLPGIKERVKALTKKRADEYYEELDRSFE